MLETLEYLERPSKQNLAAILWIDSNLAMGVGNKRDAAYSTIGQIIIL